MLHCGNGPALSRSLHRSTTKGPTMRHARTMAAISATAFALTLAACSAPVMRRGAAFNDAEHGQLNIDVAA